MLVLLALCNNYLLNGWSFTTDTLKQKSLLCTAQWIVLVFNKHSFPLSHQVDGKQRTFPQNVRGAYKQVWAASLIFTTCCLKAQTIDSVNSSGCERVCQLFWSCIRRIKAWRNQWTANKSKSSLKISTLLTSRSPTFCLSGLPVSANLLWSTSVSVSV